jgi:hypothetical protein
MKIVFRGNQDNSTSNREMESPNINADHLEHTAITMENAPTKTILTLGSRECITEFLAMRLLSNIFPFRSIKKPREEISWENIALVALSFGFLP